MAAKYKVGDFVWVGGRDLAKIVRVFIEKRPNGNVLYELDDGRSGIYEEWLTPHIITQPPIPNDGIVKDGKFYELAESDLGISCKECDLSDFCDELISHPEFMMPCNMLGNAKVKNACFKLSQKFKIAEK